MTKTLISRSLFLYIGDMKFITDENLQRKIMTLGLSSTDAIKITYGIKLILADISKVLILVPLAIFYGKLEEYFIITLISAFIRLHAGGNHFDSYFKCLIFSIGYYLFMFYFITIEFQSHIVILFGAIACLIYYVIGPIVSKTRKNIKNIKLKSIKLRLMIFVIMSLVFYTIKTTYLSDILMKVVIVQAYLILVEEVRKWYKQLKSSTQKFY